VKAFAATMWARCARSRRASTSPETGGLCGSLDGNGRAQAGGGGQRHAIASIPTSTGKEPDETRCARPCGAQRRIYQDGSKDPLNAAWVPR
jgi:hypothetical protein